MAQKRFSARHRTFEEWHRATKPGPYRDQIERQHAFNPQASLAQLRRHPRKGEKPISKLKKAPLHKIPSKFLKAKDKRRRQKSLKVLKRVRTDNVSLTQAAKEERITPSAVRRSTGAFRQRGRRWVAKSRDMIPREMMIMSDGDEFPIQLDDSRNASILGRHHNAVRKMLLTGDESDLRQFRGKRIRDAFGNTYPLETDPETINEIVEQRPDEEFYMIYAG